LLGELGTVDGLTLRGVARQAGARTPILRSLVDQLTAALAASESVGARLRLPADRAAIVLLVGLVFDGA
jgi:hypothetical protein